jgi:hypothetical protein
MKDQIQNTLQSMLMQNPSLRSLIAIDPARTIPVAEMDFSMGTFRVSKCCETGRFLLTYHYEGADLRFFIGDNAPNGCMDCDTLEEAFAAISRELSENFESVGYAGKSRWWSFLPGWMYLNPRLISEAFMPWFQTKIMEMAEVATYPSDYSGEELRQIRTWLGWSAGMKQAC